MAVAILLHGSRIRTLTKNDCKHVQVSKITFLYSLPGYILWDGKRNDDIKNEYTFNKKKIIIVY